MSTLIRLALRDHGAVAAAPNVPQFTTPAAVPGLVQGLKWTVW